MVIQILALFAGIASFNQVSATYLHADLCVSQNVNYMGTTTMCPRDKFMHGLSTKTNSYGDLDLKIECCSFITFEKEFVYHLNDTLKTDHFWHSRRDDVSATYDFTKSKKTMTGLKCRGDDCETWKKAFVTPVYRGEHLNFGSLISIPEKLASNDTEIEQWFKCPNNAMMTGFSHSSDGFRPKCHEVTHTCPPTTYEVGGECICVLGYREQAIECHDGYCRNDCLACEDGHYCEGGHGLDCREGIYCKEGFAYVCPPGTSSILAASECYDLQPGCKYPVVHGDQDSKCETCFEGHYLDVNGDCQPVMVSITTMKKGTSEISMEFHNPAHPEIININLVLTETFDNQLQFEVTPEEYQAIKMKQLERKELLQKNTEDVPPETEEEIKNKFAVPFSPRPNFNKAMNFEVDYISGDAIFEEGVVRLYKRENLEAGASFMNYKIKIALKKIKPGWNHIYWVSLSLHGDVLSPAKQWVQNLEYSACGCDGNSLNGPADLKYTINGFDLCLSWTDRSLCETNYKIYRALPPGLKGEPSLVGEYNSEDCAYGSQCGSSISEQCGVIKNTRVCDNIWEAQNKLGYPKRANYQVDYYLETELIEDVQDFVVNSSLSFTMPFMAKIKVFTNLLKMKTKITLNRAVFVDEVSTVDYSTDDNVVKLLDNPLREDEQIALREIVFPVVFQDPATLNNINAAFTTIIYPEYMFGSSKSTLKCYAQKLEGARTAVPCTKNEQKFGHLEELEIHVYDFELMLVKGRVYYNKETNRCPKTSVKVCIMAISNEQKECQMTNEYGLYTFQVKQDAQYEITIDEESDTQFYETHVQELLLGESDTEPKFINNTHSYTVSLEKHSPEFFYNFEFTKTSHVDITAHTSHCKIPMVADFQVTSNICPDYNKLMSLPSGTFEVSAEIPALPDISVSILGDGDLELQEYFYHHEEYNQVYDLREVEKTSLLFDYSGAIRMNMTILGIEDPLECNVPFIYADVEYDVAINLRQETGDGFFCSDFSKYELYVKDDPNMGGLCVNTEGSRMCKLTKFDRQLGLAYFKIKGKAYDKFMLTRKVNIELIGEKTYLKKTLEVIVRGLSSYRGKKSDLKIPAYIPAMILHTPPGDLSTTAFLPEQKSTFEHTLSMKAGELQSNLITETEIDGDKKRVCFQNMCTEIGHFEAPYARASRSNYMEVLGDASYVTKPQEGDLFILYNLRIKLTHVRNVDILYSSNDNVTKEEATAGLLEKSTDQKDEAVGVKAEADEDPIVKETCKPYVTDELLWSFVPMEPTEPPFLVKTEAEIRTLIEQLNNEFVLTSDIYEIDRIYTEIIGWEDLLDTNTRNKEYASTYSQPLYLDSTLVKNTRVCFPDADYDKLELFGLSVEDCKLKTRIYSVSQEVLCGNNDQNEFTHEMNVDTYCTDSSDVINQDVCGDMVDCDDQITVLDLDLSSQTLSDFTIKGLKKPKVLQSKIYSDGSYSQTDLKIDITDLRKITQTYDSDLTDAKFYLNTKRSYVETTTSLEDKDEGDELRDRFHIDRSFQTLIHETISGTSQCPVEKGTIARNKYHIKVNDKYNDDELMKQGIFKDLEVGDKKVITFDLVNEDKLQGKIFHLNLKKLVPELFIELEDPSLSLYETNKSLTNRVTVGPGKTRSFELSVSHFGETYKNFTQKFTLEACTFCGDVADERKTLDLEFRFLDECTAPVFYTNDYMVAGEDEVHFVFSYVPNSTYHPIDIGTIYEIAFEQYPRVDKVQFEYAHLDRPLKEGEEPDWKVFEKTYVSQNYIEESKPNSTKGLFYESNREDLEQYTEYEYYQIWADFHDLKKTGDYLFRATSVCTRPDLEMEYAHSVVATGQIDLLRPTLMTDSKKYKGRKIPLNYGDTIHFYFNEGIDCSPDFAFHASLNVDNGTHYTYDKDIAQQKNAFLFAECEGPMLAFGFNAELPYSEVMDKMAYFTLCGVTDLVGNEMQGCVTRRIQFMPYTKNSDVEFIKTRIVLAFPESEVSASNRFDDTSVKYVVIGEMKLLGFDENDFKIDLVTHRAIQDIHRAVDDTSLSTGLEYSLDDSLIYYELQISFFSHDDVSAFDSLHRFENWITHIHTDFKDFVGSDAKAKKIFWLRFYLRLEPLPIVDVQINEELLDAQKKERKARVEERKKKIDAMHKEKEKMRSKDQERAKREIPSHGMY